ncbi:LysE family translocator [Streptomyces acidiscabies]|uniref:LysE family translocator n=1 Tax=Streptomyces acidiscabies TaxID=42234 RepID=UPI00073F3615|nr:LysE family translocator [Streptomyces acidiscabies]GAQ55625.1 threonine efflux protein [Streptomyces acidiscabies]
MLTSLAAFAGAAFLVSMVPGPSTIVILRRAATDGRRYGMATVLGNECGVLVWGLATAFGLSALLLASRLAYDAIRITGAVVLVWMGVRALWQARRLHAAPAQASPAASPSLRRAFAQGLVTNLANPKAGVFAIAFLPQFVPSSAPTLPLLLALAVIWAAMDLIWYTPLVWLAGRAGGFLQRPQIRRRMERLCGTLLIGLGVRLAAQP